MRSLLIMVVVVEPVVDAIAQQSMAFLLSLARECLLIVYPISGPVALELLSPISTGSPFKGIRQNAVKIHPKRFSRKNLVSFPCQTMEKCNFDFRDGNTRRTEPARVGFRKIIRAVS